MGMRESSTLCIGSGREERHHHNTKFRTFIINTAMQQKTLGKLGWPQARLKKHIRSHSEQPAMQ